MASLLFQAPAFQAPTFREPEPPSHDEEEPAERTPRRRRGGRAAAERDDEDRAGSDRATQDRTDSEDNPEGGAESAKPARKRRSRRKKDVEAEAPATETSGEEGKDTASPDAVEEEPKKRSRRSSRSKQSKEDKKEDRAQEGSAADSSASDSDRGGSPEGSGHGDEGAHASSDSHADEDEDQEGGTSRRRRRRRSRSSQSRGSEDPSDQVTALKGSTRLEAKKQRRREGRKEGRRRHLITESEFLARREAVDRQMVIRHHNGLDQIALIEDGLLVEHYVTRRTQQSMVGNIYLGRVQNVLPSMEAAFIDIGRGRNAVLYAGEVNWDAVGLEGRPRRIEAALKSGDPVLVQVTKDPIGHKGARLTSQITLAGRYLVLIPNGSMMGISRKLPEKERQRLKKILKKAVPGGSGVIVRTAAEGASEQQLADDIARLTKQWADIEAKQKKTKSAPVLLRGEPELAVRVVRDIFNEDFKKLVIQGRETFDTVSEYVHDLSPELSDRVEQWVGTEDVFHGFRIDEQLAKGMDRKVWLPSGGTLIIDRTEAMTVIDVNTGKYIGAGGTLEETVTRNNLEAAEEIVRQLRLRDIGGIIIVDFVDMVLESNRDLVLRRLVECLGRDRTRHQVTEITSLGLVQMTRKRVGEGLVEAFSTPCEVCEGRGFIVHMEPVEHTGSADHTGGGHSSGRGKGRKTVEEPRRLDEDVDRDRTREALSAIAAASGHSSRSTDEGGPAVVPVAESHPEVVANTAAAEAEETPAASEAPRTRGTRRRRAVKAPAAEPGASLSHEVPEVEAEVAAAPVESLLVSAEEPEDVEETGLVPVEESAGEATAPATSAPAKGRRTRAASSTMAGTTTPRERTGRRRAATSGAVEPGAETGAGAEQVAAVPAIELPEPVHAPEPETSTGGSRSEAQAPLIELPERVDTPPVEHAPVEPHIELPERHVEEAAEPAAKAAPRRRAGRRRAVTTSVVDPEATAPVAAPDTTAGSADAHAADAHEAAVVVAGARSAEAPQEEAPVTHPTSVDEIRLPERPTGTEAGEAAPRKARRRRRAVSTGVVDTGEQA